MTKERPLALMPDMVRAERAGIKTQTRRVVKPLQIILNRETNSLEVDEKNILNGRFVKQVPCPYGQPGDRLWVREAFRLPQAFDSLPPREVPNRIGLDGPPGKIALHYEADGGVLGALRFGKHRPAMFMCRWMSRTLLEIVSVRVERLQDISDADALAEGVDRTNTSIPGYAKERYRKLWESINGPDTWALNPWVWVIEFKRIK